MGRGRGFIHVDENLNGQYVKELPPGVDPSSVVDIQPTQETTVLETMASLLPNIDPDRRPHFQSILDELHETAAKDLDKSQILNFQHIAYPAFRAGYSTLMQYLEKSAEFHYGDGLQQGKATGVEAAATMLLRALTEGIATEKDRAARVWEMLLADLAPSLEAFAGRAVHHCIVNGFAEKVYEVLAALQQEGNGLVEGAREGLFPVGHPEMMLDLYYFGLLGAAPYLRAAMVGY